MARSEAPVQAFMGIYIPFMVFILFIEHKTGVTLTENNTHSGPQRW